MAKLNPLSCFRDGSLYFYWYMTLVEESSIELSVPASSTKDSTADNSTDTALNKISVAEINDLSRTPSRLRGKWSKLVSRFDQVKGEKKNSIKGGSCKAVDQVLSDMNAIERIRYLRLRV